MSNDEEPLFDYVNAVKNQRPVQRPIFGPSPRQRSNPHLLHNIPSYNPQKDIKISSKDEAGSKSSSVNSSASSNKSRWSNFAKTPSPPRETPKFAKARTTHLQSTKCKNLSTMSEKSSLNTIQSASKGSRQDSVVKSQPNNRLFQTPSQTINSTSSCFMNEKTNPEVSLDASSKLKKLEKIGIWDKIKSLTSKIQIDEEEAEDDDEESEQPTAIENKNHEPGRCESESEDDDDDIENKNQNANNKFLVNDSIMIIKETFSARKKMMQLGMLPVPKNQLSLTSPDKSICSPTLHQQRMSRYFPRVDSKEIKQSSLSDLKKSSENVSKPNYEEPMRTPTRSKSETSIYEITIPVNEIQEKENFSIVEQNNAREQQSNKKGSSLKKSISNREISSRTPKAVNSLKSSSCSSVQNEEQNQRGSSLKKSDHKGSQDPKNDLKKIRIRGKLYYLLSLLGQGGSAKVYQVYDPTTQKNLAVKVVDLIKSDESTRAGYENEINLLQKLSKCKRVVKLIDYERIWSQDGVLKRLFLVMEKGDADLSNVLKNFIEKEESSNKYLLDPHLIKHYWKEMLKAVDEIHSLDVVHSDLKPVNFITVAGRLKLIDFGIANAIETDATSVIKDNQIGTINYMAPESLQSRSDIIPPSNFKSSRPGSNSKQSSNCFIKYNCKADIWSLGCILYNLVYGKPPFGHLPNLVSKIQAICNQNFVIPFTPLDDPDLLDCLMRCLDRDPRRRPTAKQLLEHAYLTRCQTVANASKSAIGSTPGRVTGFRVPDPPHVRTFVDQINNLTPSRIDQLSKFLENLSHK